MEGMGLTPLDSNLHKYHLVTIFQIMLMIDADNFWHQKTFNVVLTALWRRWDDQILELKDVSMHCTEISEINNKMDGVEIIDLFSESKTKNGEQCEGKESSTQESQDKMKINTIVRKKAKNRPGEGRPMTENEENDTDDQR